MFFQPFGSLCKIIRLKIEDFQVFRAKKPEVWFVCVFEDGMRYEIPGMIFMEDNTTWV